MFDSKTFENGQDKWKLAGDHLGIPCKDMKDKVAIRKLKDCGEGLFFLFAVGLTALIMNSKSPRMCQKEIKALTVGVV